MFLVVRAVVATLLQAAAIGTRKVNGVIRAESRTKTALAEVPSGVIALSRESVRGAYGK